MHVHSAAVAEKHIFTQTHNIRNTRSQAHTHARTHAHTHTNKQTTTTTHNNNNNNNNNKNKNNNNNNNNNNKNNSNLFFHSGQRQLAEEPVHDCCKWRTYWPLACHQPVRVHSHVSMATVPPPPAPPPPPPPSPPSFPRCFVCVHSDG